MKKELRMEHVTQYSTTNESAPNIWFALRIKKLLITEAVG